MKKIYTTIFAFMLAFSSFAQNSSNASKLLNEVSSKMASYKNMFIKFNYTLENTEVNMKQESKGSVYTSGEKYNLKFMDNTFIYDGKKTYVIATEDEEVNIVKGKSDDEMLTPNKLLFFYKEGFTYIWDALKTINGKKIQFVKLIPINSKSESANFLIGIDTATKTIYNITDNGKNGTKTIFTIEYLKTNQTLSKNLFVFNKGIYTKKGYTINE